MTRVAVLCLLLGVSAPARAVDGCVILLCLAGSWSSIPQCVGPVRQLFRDLARGKPFPTCAMARGPGGSRALAERATEQNCPRQYSSWGGESGAMFSCAFRGVIRVEVAGAAPQARPHRRSNPLSQPTQRIKYNRLDSEYAQKMARKAAREIDSGSSSPSSASEDGSSESEPSSSPSGPAQTTALTPHTRPMAKSSSVVR